MASTTTEILKTRYPDLAFDTLLPPDQHPGFHYNGFKPGTSILPKGHTKGDGLKALAADLIYERDVAISMRDGVKLYADVFRSPASESTKVPALMPWSPYGKSGTGSFQYDTMAPFRAAIPKERTSGYEKFEAPDPAEWCERGYAIINIDARGAGKSGGDLHFWGIQEAEDIYDTITWISEQPWCNASVGLVGNSWLAMSQINFVSRFNHPALKAIAPMEAATDSYRDVQLRGGMAHNPGFDKLISGGMAGPNLIEDLPGMVSKRPFFDDYWQDKQVKTENIKDLPLYIVASYSSMLHSRGSFETFRNAKSSQKWLRVHPFQEWFDIYRADVNDELQKYFDRYLKNVDNNWEETVPVRLSLLGFEGSSAKTVVERAEYEWPLARQQLTTFHLDAANMSLQPGKDLAPAQSSYDSQSLTSHSDFTLYFSEATEIAGYAMARLYMSCATHDDLDVTVQIRKISASGELLEHLNYPMPVPVSEVPNVNTSKCLGPQGYLRASHAVTRDDSKSDTTEVFYTHDRREPIAPGTIVPLDITFWPMGMVFAAGEGIMLRISGHDMAYPEVPFILPTPNPGNVGEHLVHTGGQHLSFLVLPLIPEK